MESSRSESLNSMWISALSSVWARIPPFQPSLLAALPAPRRCVCGAESCRPPSELLQLMGNKGPDTYARLLPSICFQIKSEVKGLLPKATRGEALSVAKGF